MSALLSHCCKITMNRQQINRCVNRSSTFLPTTSLASSRPIVCLARGYSLLITRDLTTVYSITRNQINKSHGTTHHYNSTKWASTVSSTSTHHHEITVLPTVHPLFNKILIANRGEIACRVIRTAKRLGIQTVAVYSEADASAMHVTMADEAYLIGPAPSSQSYLVAENIIRIAKACGAQAIHPGYGFLSENAGFAEQLQREGLVFIGPPAGAIIAMGSKSASKNIMTEAGVPCVPGYHGENQDPAFLKSRADEMGYPVLIKAVKGGGGKGMRIVQDSEEFDVMLTSAKRESAKSFGDDAVLVEKYITRPRHVEVQVFADMLGNAVYLFERDCSVQRRHQKVIEEAPAPLLPDEVKRSLGEKAVAAAKAVGYVGAGTVEFILDTTTNSFYFMEMNTRLQVEHPVTEMITGTDLVEWQLTVASGNRLPKLQHELVCTGHAFEARVYAESPRNNFLPDTGKLRYLSFPKESATVRIDTGVNQGDVVSVHYDPMISKLIVYGSDRTEALRILRNALAEFHVVGLSTNIAFLQALASHPDFIAGDVETGFIAKKGEELFARENMPAPPEAVIQAALFTILSKTNPFARPTTPSDPWAITDSFQPNSIRSTTLHLTESEKKHGVVSQFQVEISTLSDRSFHIRLQSKPGTDSTSPKSWVFSNVVCTGYAEDVLHTNTGTCTLSTPVVPDDKGRVHVFYQGDQFTFTLPVPEYESRLNAGASAGSVTTPMPCKISNVMVSAGQAVKVGQLLIVLEAMKMEHVIKSPKAGIIAKVNFKVGDLVPQGKTLVQFKDE